MQQGKPSGLAKNARGGICPAGRDCTFEGVPLYGGGGRRYYKLCKYANNSAHFFLFTVIHYVKDRRYIRQKAGRINHAHSLFGLRRVVLARYAALRWGG